MFVLAHLSDPHLAPLPRPRFYELAGKRLSGYANWRLNRQHFHLRTALDAIIADLKSQHVDHIAVTGDLVNLSLASEFEPARAWLAELGEPRDVTVIPGNHDAYVVSKSRHALRHWADYMAGDDALPAGFPFVRRRGAVALIGLTTGVPTPPFFATGRVGKRQLAELARVLDELGQAQLFRIVLIHHPPITRPGRHLHRLTDADAFVAILAEHGAELVLHGHEHLDLVRRIDTPRGPVPVVGVASASAGTAGKYDLAGYHLYTISGRFGAWRCELLTRGLDRNAGAVIERRRTTLIG
jgi:3',5'-cyclic AMP phosphodiesterase CpdA